MRERAEENGQEICDNDKGDATTARVKSIPDNRARFTLNQRQCVDGGGSVGGRMKWQRAKSILFCNRMTKTSMGKRDPSPIKPSLRL